MTLFIKITDELNILFKKLDKDLKCNFGFALSEKYTLNNESILLLFFDNNFDEGKRKEKMVSTDQAKNAIQVWKHTFSDCKKCIFICPGKLSPDAKKEVSMENLFLITHEFLLIPVARHAMVPKHEALSEKDAEIFSEHRKIMPNQLPQLKIHDPISIYYGFEIGTIVKVRRPGWDVYRVVSS
jgi:DNA-directed RNA polymerase subunit H (RpoH/RPB5)